ncbi:MAG: acyl-CoA thioesterase [Granulosicoccus sp.]|nr:acyl-CoA thioesterase [Granulosicoccus sp.]
MKLLLRLCWLIMTQRWRSRCSILGPVDTKLVVFPSDLDTLMHVNNGVFFTYADLGRVDLLLRANAMKRLQKLGWYPVVAAESMQFKKSLTLGQVFSIRTEVLGWSDKSIYLQQIFSRHGRMIARAMIDARFLKRSGGTVNLEELLDHLEINSPSPEFPDYLHHWIASNKASRESSSIDT